MQVKYSSLEKNSLLNIISHDGHLADIDCFIDLALEIRRQLESLRTRTESCIFQLNGRINDLQSAIKREQELIAEAEKAIQNTPTVEVTYADPQSAQKGEAATPRPINQDVIAKYNDQISYHTRQISEYSRKLAVFEEDMSVVREGEIRVSEHISAVNTVIDQLGYARESAKKDCVKYENAIKYAAQCMENYSRVRVGHRYGGGVSYIKPKERR